MTQYLSDKIKVLSFISIILVLYIHSGFHNIPSEIQCLSFNYYLQESISNMVGRCAVPLFYVISGYLFFLHTDGGVSAVLLKMRRRIKTLLMPFVIAALFFPFFFLCMELFPFTRNFINGDGTFSNNLQLPLGEIIKSLFYAANGTTTPWAFHLWFLRDLIMIVMVSPLLYIIKKGLGSGVILTILFFLTFCQFRYSFINSLFWFMLGDAFLPYIGKFKSLMIFVAFLVLSAIELMLPNLPWNYLRILIIVLGIISIWNLYDRLIPLSFELRKHKWLTMACQFTFFIYLFHEPTLNIVRKLLILILGRSSIGFAVNYLVSPWIFVILFILVGFYFKKYLPRIYDICVGGR